MFETMLLPLLAAAQSPSPPARPALDEPGIIGPFQKGVPKSLKIGQGNGLGSAKVCPKYARVSQPRLNAVKRVPGADEVLKGRPVRQKKGPWLKPLI